MAVTGMSMTEYRWHIEGMVGQVIAERHPEASYRVARPWLEIVRDGEIALLRVYVDVTTEDAHELLDTLRERLEREVPAGYYRHGQEATAMFFGGEGWEETDERT